MDLIATFRGISEERKPLENFSYIKLPFEPESFRLYSRRRMAVLKFSVYREKSVAPVSVTSG